MTNLAEQHADQFVKADDKEALVSAALDRIFNPDSGCYGDPYPAYSILQELAPIVRVNNLPEPLWLLTSYVDVQEVLRDSATFVHRIEEFHHSEFYAQIKRDNISIRLLDQWFIAKDPPDHTRLRGLVNRFFTSGSLVNITNFVENLVQELVANLKQKNDFDLIKDFAYQVPIRVFGHMFGIPWADTSLFNTWVKDIGRLLDPTFKTPAIMQRGNEAGLALHSYFSNLANTRRAHPQDDIFTFLVREGLDQKLIDEEELIGTCLLLLIGGSETTINLIGNGFLALLQHKDQYDLLAAQPELMESAVEEFLRYDAPSQLTVRRVAKKLEFKGVEFQRGDLIALCTGAANRDPSRFTNPQALDIRRKDNRHLSFGYGVHFCIGAALGRLEARYAISGLMKLCNELPADAFPVKRRPHLCLRGIESLKLPVNQM